MEEILSTPAIEMLFIVAIKSILKCLSCKMINISLGVKVTTYTNKNTSQKTNHVHEIFSGSHEKSQSSPQNITFVFDYFV